MGSYHPWQCRTCGARRPFVHISKRGYCLAHGNPRSVANATSLAAREGPEWERWLQAQARAIVALARRTPSLPNAPEQG